MNTHQTDEELMKKAAARVRHRIWLIIHIIFWLVISAIIIFVVDLNTGLMLFAFFGITVIGNVIAYCVTSGKSKKGYSSAIEREFEKMKSEQKK